MSHSATSPTSTRIDVPAVKVYVFGAGVAGLTAAHELILRGFDVCVYESERALGPQGVLEEQTVGGMARTQYVAVSPQDEKSSKAEVYYQVADLEPLARTFLKKASGASDSEQLTKGFSPERTKDLLFSFFKRALTEILVRDEVVANRALVLFRDILQKYVAGEFRDMVDRAVPWLKNSEEKTLRALAPSPQPLGDDFKARDLIKSERVEAFRQELRSLFETTCAANTEFVKEWIERSQKLLLKVPPGKPDKRKVASRLAHVLVQSLRTALRGLTEEAHGNEKLEIGSRIRLVRFLKEFLGGSDGRLNEEVVAVLPWRVAEPLISVLRRILVSDRDPLDKLRDSFKDMRPPGVEAPMFHEAAPALRFADFWIKFEDTGKQGTLTATSKEHLLQAIEYINQLINEGEFLVDEYKQPGLQIFVRDFNGAPVHGLALGRGGMAAEQDRLAQVFVKGLTEDETVKLWLKGARRSSTKGAKRSSNVEVPTLPEPLKNRVRSYDQADYCLPPTLEWVRPAKEEEQYWVQVIVHRPQLPGEHGYRFFPSYYRHVFDTMKRIPRQKADGRPMGGTVLDNLVSLPQIGIFSQTSAPFLMSWNPLQAGDALSRLDYNLRNAANLNLRSQDLLQFSLRVLRYMTSCSQRRAAEMEEQSWWDYLEGFDTRSGTRLYKYSDSFKQLVQSSSRVLAALDGASGDARTCGNTYVQLMTQAMVPTPNDNSTLNGPTSEAWFFHWKTHLEHLGVEFCHGELQRLKLRESQEPNEPPELVAEVFLPGKQMVQELPLPGEAGSDPVKGPFVYFLVATDLLSATHATEVLRDQLATQIKDFAYKSPARQDGTRRTEREPAKQFAREKGDRLQTISGIQYFFKRHVNVFDGYIYCVDAEWGLSAICSHLVWQDRPSGRRSAYQSILSVDIGDWNKKSIRLKKEAWRCTPEELQEEVLHQIRISLSARGVDQNPASFVLPDPDWVHIDDYLEYGTVARKPSVMPRPQGESKRRMKLRSNKSLYLVPIAGDWKHRPGPEPWDPTYQTPLVTPWSYEGRFWQAPHGGYPVYYERLVFAGTYLRTFTRMTTMESANESARHAVNAILDHCVSRLPQHKSLRGFWDSPAGGNFANPYDKGVFPTTPFGDYCRVWNPERNELPDFELLQRQDEQNWNEGKPHPWDAVGLELMPALMTQVYNSGTLLDELMKRVNTRNKETPLAVHGVLAALRHLREVLEVRHPPQGR